MDVELLKLLSHAHERAALENQSISSQVIAQTGTSFDMAVIAAIATTGGIHAPIDKARTLLELSEDELKQAIPLMFAIGKRVPGLGNSFFKSGIDPAFEQVDRYLAEHYTELYARIELITKLTNKDLYPNAAMYTAAAAIILNIPRGGESYLLIQARIPAWFQIWRKQWA